jgi:uncharacterized protein YceK
MIKLGVLMVLWALLSGCSVVMVAADVVTTTVGVAVDVVDAVTPDIVD